MLIKFPLYDKHIGEIPVCHENGMLAFFYDNKYSFGIIKFNITEMLRNI